MAITWVLSLKLLLISTGLVSISMLLKISIPLVTQLICYEIPIIWSCIMSLLRPPYLYFVINAIIIIIAVTSRCHDKDDVTGQSQPLVSQPDAVPVYAEVAHEVGENVAVNDDMEVREEDEVVVVRSTWTPPERSKSLERLPEKPLVSTRFVGGPKGSPQGGKSSRSKQNDTIENTWKTIAEVRPSHLIKCDTTENQDRPIISTVKINTKPLGVKKSATFRDRTNYDPTVKTSLGAPKFRKEPSLSQDELNHRVEAFIRKFQDEMRLQRQESLNHYMDMIKRGAH